MAKRRFSNSSKRQRKQSKQLLHFEALEVRRLLSVTPPTVEGVFVSSDSWSEVFQTELANDGFGNEGDSLTGNQDGVIPWSNVNQIVVRFNEDVDVQLDDLLI